MADQFPKQFFRQFGIKMGQLIETAVTSSATHIGKQLYQVARETNQPTDIFIDKIKDSVKTGVFAAGKEMLTNEFGRDDVEPVNSPINSPVNSPVNSQDDLFDLNDNADNNKLN